MSKKLFILISISFILLFISASYATNDTIVENDAIENQDSIYINESVDELNIEEKEIETPQKPENAAATTLTPSDSTVVQGTPFSVVLKSGNTGLPNQQIRFNINGVEYYKVTDNTGKASITINLSPNNNYWIYYYFSGTTAYSASQGSTYINVIERNTHIDFMATKIQQTSRLGVSLLDSLDNRVANKDITIQIVGRSTYVRTTDSNGVAYLNINLDSGTYQVICTFAKTGGYLYSTKTDTITVFLKDTNVHILNTNIYSGNKIQVKLLDSDYIPVANKVVKLKINNLVYSVTTNDKGYGIFNGYLSPGTYSYSTYTENQAGYKASAVKSANLYVNNAVICNSIKLTAENSVVKYGQNFKVTMKNSNGVAISGQVLTFIINGQSYTRTTGSDGVANMQLNLDPDYYPIVVKYTGTNYDFNFLYQLVHSPVTSTSMNFNTGGPFTISQYITYNTAYNNLNDNYMISLSNNLTKNCENDLEKAISIYNHVYNFKKVSHAPNGGSWYNALNSLLLYEGNCVDHTNPFISLCKQSNIPVRIVTGDSASPNQLGHEWAQVLINGIWVIADPTNTVKLGSWSSPTFINHEYWLSLNGNMYFGLHYS